MTPVTMFSGSSQTIAPHLFLYSLNPGGFATKHINLAGNQRIKIGRQTNVRTVPSETNGYFDSKVLSRAHAEVWEENGKIWMKDVKSSNGTFINSERLSPEGLESEPWEIKTDDIVEFGIDIVGEDNKSIVHHKVAARAVCVFTEQDMARAEQQGQFAARGQHGQHPQASSSGLNGAQGGFGFGNQRRPQAQQTGLGGMGAGMVNTGNRGKSITFDHILHRLQGELKVSRETSAELHNISTVMGDVRETLGGALPPTLPPYPQHLPPVRAPPSANHRSSQSPQPEQIPPVALSELQTQLHNTQSSLALHVDKIRALEGVFAEHEAIKQEVGNLRDLVESGRDHSRLYQDGLSAEILSARDAEDFVDDDDDDTRSVATTTPHTLERVIEDEEDEEPVGTEESEGDNEDDERRRRRRAALGRPRTPEPNAIMHQYDDDQAPRRASPLSDPPIEPSIIKDLNSRLAILSEQLETALLLSSSLQAQHTQAQMTISALESKLLALETLVQESLPKPSSTAKGVDLSATESPSLPAFQESLTQTLNEWKKGVEGQWSSIQEEWSVERARLGKAREEWEAKSKGLEEGLASLAAAQLQRGLPSRISTTGGGGLATPPSPTRSISSDSSRNRARKRRIPGKGRSRSGSRDDAVTLVDDDALTKVDFDGVVRTHSPTSSQADESASDSESRRKHSPSSSKDEKLKYLETPDSSVHAEPTSRKHPTAVLPATSPQQSKSMASQTDMATMSTAVGVVVLSLAAAAVIWRVKE